VMAEQVSRRLLVVVYDYPPSPSVGAVRWRGMTNYLAQLGHSVTVVTSDSFGAPSDADPVRVMRPRSLETLRPFTHRSHLNPRVGWAPFALRAARRVLRSESFDCVITTSPPESAHLVGLMLGRRRPPWVADFRDGWCFEPYTVRFRRGAHRAVDRWLERTVASAADVTVGTTQPLAEDLAHRLGARARWIPNGWDPAEGGAENEDPWPGVEEGGLRLVYTGRLRGALGCNPEPLFHAMRAVNSDADVPRLRFVHAGVLTPEDRMLIDRAGVSELVQHVGLLDRPKVLALQRSADVLVLITSHNSSVATGKLFEYLAAGRPILALAQGNEAARIVRETRTGVAVPPDDRDAIAKALRGAARGDLAREYAPQGIERYAFPRLAEEAADVVEEAIAVHASRQKSG
jgi:glycosyltransferase involved in cell wall biosynthesis